MIKDEILAMKPGRELDALVAEKVMGWKKETAKNGFAEFWDNGQFCSGKWLVDWNPSENISAAWEVVERFEAVELKKYFADKELWVCEIKTRVWHRSYADSAPEAICKASLLCFLEG